MSKLKAIIIVLCIQLIVAFSFSQENPIKSDFIESLKAQYTNPKGKTLNPAVAEFEKLWSQGFLDSIQKNRIQFILTKIKQKGLHRNQIKFIRTINLFKSGSQPSTSLNAFLKEALEHSKQKVSRNFKKLLDKCYLLLKMQQLNKMASMGWYYRGGSFELFHDGQLKIKFKDGDLVCKSRNDSSEIFHTNGVFIPSDFKWTGTGGVLRWKRLNMDKFRKAEFKKYEIHLNSSQYTIDSAEFLDHKYLKVPMFGRLKEKVLASKPNKRTSYPRFNSYRKDYNINSLLGVINFKGGVNILGRTIICMADENALVQIDFKRDTIPFVRLGSTEFIVNGDQINSKRAKAIIFLDKDSIYHPSVQFRYNQKSKELILNRKAIEIAPTPFYNSYHKINMYCEVISWNLDSLKLELRNRRNTAKRSEAIYESVNFFSEYEYYRLQGMDLVNPLILIKKYSEKYNTKEIHISLLAEYMKKPEDQASNLLFNLAEKGFVAYDVKNRKAIIQNRLYDFLKAKAGLKDHDVIQYKSETKGKSSASLDLKDFNLYIRGVKEIFLSDSQKVQIMPYKNEIIMKKNRDFLFSGNVKGGLFDFGAGDCEFQYDQFKLNMPEIDSMSFFVKNPKPDKKNPDKLIKVKSVLANLSGDVRIDNPENKSGNISYPEYPIFRNINEAYVYYEDSLIMNNTLKKKGFYYFVQPFTIDSLDNFSTDGLGFNGYMVTDSIFPVIHKDLQVMPDYSLGFRYDRSRNGIPVYRNKGKLYAIINLSHEGFFANGKLDWISSTSQAEKFSIYPDSLIATLNHFNIQVLENDTIYPNAKGTKLDFKWEPYQNKLRVKSIDSAFVLYEEAKLNGSLTLTPHSLLGTGEFQLENFKLKSDKFNFSLNKVYSDTTDFNLFTEDEQLAFSSKNYKVDIHLKNRKGYFKSNGANAVTAFPLNNFITTMDEIIWEMDSAQLYLNNNIAAKIPGINKMSHEELLDVDLSGSYFLSLKPEQDSLSFYTLKARYAMDSNILYAEDVKYINVANAAVFPSDGKIVIKENAVIPTIKNATIISDLNKQYHKVYNADVNIFSKNNFIAKGSYDYLDANKNLQEIKLNTVAVDSLNRTYALGNIPEDELFFLSPHFFYQGDIKWTSDNPLVRFYGGFRINQDCIFNDSVWVKFDTIINPDELKIPLKEKIVDLKNRRLDIGLFYSPTEGVMYSRFLTSKSNIKDRDIFKARGVIRFNQEDELFEVAPNRILEGKSKYGNKISLNPQSCIIKGQGGFELNDPIRELYIRSFGEFSHSITEDTTAFRLILSLDFLFDKTTLNVMFDSINAIKLPKISMRDEFIQRAFVNAANSESEKDILYDLEWYGEIRKQIDQFKETLIFDDIRFKWDKEKRIYISRGKIGLGMINNKQIHRYVDGIIVIDRKKSNNSIEIYLEPEAGHWYYFSMKNKLMQAISSDKVFNAKLSEVEQSKRMIKKDDIIQYEFVISDRKKKIDFLRKYKR